MPSFLHYNISLSDAEMRNILLSDFWMIRNIGAGIFPGGMDPLKFDSTASIFVTRGSWKADINMTPFELEAPSVINVRASQILLPRWVSDDMEASCIVMSKRFTDNLFLLLRDSPLYMEATRRQVFRVPEEYAGMFRDFYERMAAIFEDVDNPYAYQAQVLGISSFFHQICHKCYSDGTRPDGKTHSRLPDRFLNLLQQHCKRERFLDFYARELSVSTKHLSRTLKEETGVSAVEWIDRYVILEAKVLLKSTSMTVQQIACELNFSDQSSFGKYFKKFVGQTPTDFRNL